MPSSDIHAQLSLVEAQLFASTELTVIAAIDESEDIRDAVARLQVLGMTEPEAETVLEMPLRTRTRGERAALFARAERLRAQID